MERHLTMAQSAQDLENAGAVPAPVENGRVAKKGRRKAVEV
jgi:hypothetical protein